jgi:NAD(P)-dependent dehydrogenase (short-subunit alcohol dehydrogenase family)
MTARRFAGKVALVTGASRGIGRACAVRLAKEGALVAVNHFASTPEQTLKEIAAPVAFLLSDEARYFTSAELLVDGGFIVNAE